MELQKKAVRMSTLPSAEKLNELCEGEFININEGSGHDEKDEDVPKEVTTGKKKRFHFKRII